MYNTIYIQNYEKLSKKELIRKLEKKDKQIAEMECHIERVKANMQKDIDNAKNIRFENFQELEKENQNLKNKYNDLKQLHEFEIKSIKNQSETQIEGLKETIVMMATASYNAQESFFQTLRDIDKKLNLVIGRSRESE